MLVLIAFVMVPITPTALGGALLSALRGDIEPAFLAQYRRLHLDLHHDASHSAAVAITDLIAATSAKPAAVGTSDHTWKRDPEH